jgi:thiosulfate reductase cytochrome b subunit
LGYQDGCHKGQCFATKNKMKRSGPSNQDKSFAALQQQLIYLLGMVGLVLALLVGFWFESDSTFKSPIFMPQ